MVDPLTAEIARYVCGEEPAGDEARATAALALEDALGCALLALAFPACRRLLGPWVAGTIVPGGCRIPGTGYLLDPVSGAFNLGTMIRWLDFNDTWLAKEWGHPSDNIGGLGALADFLARAGKKITVGDLLTAMIKAYEIQGVLALKNSFNSRGFDHVVFVKAATAAMAAWLLGGGEEQVASALSQVWADGIPLRCYRHAPNVGSRKSWAAGDATSRGVALALLALRGEAGPPTALTAKRWGLYDVLFEGKPFILEQPLGSYVMENILFKVSYPAEFHGQTAVEAAVALHPQVRGRLDEIALIAIETQEPAVRIIDKKGALSSSADRDHCLQYMVAAALLHGTLDASHYEEEAAADPRLEVLRSKMQVSENKSFTDAYYAPGQRAIANAVTITFNDGSSTERCELLYPLGHRRRRSEALPLLREKFCRNAAAILPKKRVDLLTSLFDDKERLEAMAVDTFFSLFVDIE